MSNNYYWNATCKDCGEEFHWPHETDDNEICDLCREERLKRIEEENINDSW